MTFPFIHQRGSTGRLRLHGWYFGIRACALHVFDPVRQVFEPID